MERPEYEFGRRDLDFLRWWGVPTLSGAHMCPTRPSATQNTTRIAFELICVIADRLAR